MDDAQPGDAPISPLSCFICRKRKAKCTRELPKCSLCSRLSLDCSYPLEAQKPGRKKGSSYYKRQRHGEAGGGGGGADDDVDSPESNSNSNDRSYKAGSSSTTSSSRGHAPSTDPSSQPWSEGWDFSWLFDAPPPSQMAKAVPRLIVPAASRAPADQSFYEVQTAEQVLMERLSGALELNGADCQIMLDLYFENFGAFTLFRPRDFKKKLLHIELWDTVLALVTSIFSWSARFWTACSSRYSTLAAQPKHSADEYYEQASLHIERAVAASQKTRPSFELLQASLLKSLYEMTRGTHSAPPDCTAGLVRLANSLDIPNTDADLRVKDLTFDPDIDPAVWSRKEEVRRCWWSIWELDVLLSGLRRAPNDIDWCANHVMLPVEDHLWFEDMPTPSCFLEVDPMERWKALQNCQSLSPKAWYLVVTSMSHNAFHTPIAAFFVGDKKPARSRPEEFAVDTHYMLNSFHCFCNALPPELRFNGEFLSFEDDLLVGSSRVHDRGIYSIHLMVQFTKFTLHHRKVFGLVGPPASSAQQISMHISPDLLTSSKPWRLYLDVANNVIALSRNCPPHHVQYQHPLLALIVWLSAAVVQVYQNLGGGLTEQEQRLVQSNYEALKTTFVRYAEFWGITPALVTRLEMGEPQDRLPRALPQGFAFSAGGGDAPPAAQPLPEPTGVPDDVINKMVHRTSGHSPLGQRFLLDLFKLGG